MSESTAGDYRQVALAVTRALAARNYDGAHALTAQAYRGSTTLEGTADAFEAIVPHDWGAVGPIDIAETIEDWPGREPSDAGWGYVSIGGEMYSEAAAVVTREGGGLRVRGAEFGRP